MKQCLFISLFLLLSLPGITTVIEGSNKEYAGEKIRFFRFSDPVTLDREPMFVLEIERTGNFSAKVTIEQPTYVFAEFGIYRGMLFLEPGEKTRLRLPPFREKSFADQKNPYFSPVEFWFATESGDHLNNHILAFDSRLNQLTDRFFNQLYFQQSKTAIDSVRLDLEKQFGHIDSDLFAWHKMLKIKSVESDAFRLSPDKVTGILAEAEPAYRTHPAFIELFEKTFRNKLSFEAGAENGQRIRQAVATGNFPFFNTFLSEKYGLSGSLASLALIKMLHDGFYSGDFSQEHILQMVSSPRFSGHPDKSIRAVSANVREKLEFLREKSPAPVICLRNTDGHRICTDNTQGNAEKKFKYLLFADTEMVVCREHLKYLIKTEEQFGKYLEIIIILRKTDLIEMKIFLDSEEIPGIHLVDENAIYTNKYRVRSFPSALLLNHNHEVVFQQAKTPLDGFEQQFSSFLRRALFERQRDQSR